MNTVLSQTQIDFLTKLLRQRKAAMEAALNEYAADQTDEKRDAMFALNDELTEARNFAWSLGVRFIDAD